MYNKKIATICLLWLLVFFCPLHSMAQHEHHQHADVVKLHNPSEIQPLVAQVIRLEKALALIGSPLQQNDRTALLKLTEEKQDETTAGKIQQLLDPYCLAQVTINPEARVSVLRGAARPVLVQGGWKNFLVKVNNQAGITAPLEVYGENMAPLFHASGNEPHASAGHQLSAGQVANRFLEGDIYRNRPMQEHLSGIGLEYVILQLYSRDTGTREASIAFRAGQGTEDLAFRNSIAVLFKCLPSIKVILHVKDENGEPAMASFIIRDNIERLMPDSNTAAYNGNYRRKMALEEYGVFNKSLTGLYPLPSRRLALTDEYPDFFFQPQVYRLDGEHVNLPPGHYRITYSRGPEYIPQMQEITLENGIDSTALTFRLKRWIDMSSSGWYSADHHIHAAGCSHYESPEEGVDSMAMFRQVKGENLNVGAVLTWGPGWYHQKNFFTGTTNRLSSLKNIIRYDVEVSGFPSSHAGHLVLLNLKEDDYPGTKMIEDWPSWTAPVLRWAKQQQAVTGYAHSGWGLEPVEPTSKLPNNVLPRMDGIGANEYVVTVTQQLVDVFSAGDTPAPWELNMWYHTLNCGFRTRLSGETDFPCIFDERVGIARSYFKTTEPVSYSSYMDALKKGRSYVSDGRSHIIDFTANGVEMGTGESELRLSGAGTVEVKAKVAAWLTEKQDSDGYNIASRPLTQSPYWHIERARIGQTRKVPVELLFNGVPVDTTEIEADGRWNNVSFHLPVNRSGWIALRIYPGAHTNPVFIIVNNKPIVVKESAQWCKNAVERCWQMKNNHIRTEEKAAAKEAYDKAILFYDKLVNSVDAR